MRTLLAIAASTTVMLSAGLATAQHRKHQDQMGRMNHMDHGAPAADSREFVKFPPELVDHTLANMRDHLLTLQQINEALATGESEKAGKIAEERLGMSSLRLHGAAEVAKYMPQGMQDAGTTMHKAASRFAIEAQNVGVTGEMKPALGALGEVMSACVSCHAGYRLR
ncbi:hypothetical protein SSBR45G_14500 [Bradyrhizobium sp. SSBR45G]|uniref:hypothetical protein n=1 Tax=unclassified Bradyrhizobium TaxID=2631580 RepID=UPI002342AB02|nr:MULTISPECIES: hypothetical protein [unclassified Bradyrhizobium]GLH76542.1 hypothetical protein SSBR45G_14500 [Bradyrhizobium sp. SSBR45G]GLH84159.1 hypothetical protein SSBR45R_16190 [Bradyrhizobium sp. SSBR45R]